MGELYSLFAVKGVKAIFRSSFLNPDLANV